MKKVIIDTNSLISFVTDRNPSQQEKTASLFENAARLRLSIICHQNVITEFVYVMDKLYSIEKGKIAEIVSDFLLMPGVDLVVDVNIKTVLELWPKSVPDYGDALIAALCKQTKNASIATFDVKFRKALSRLSLPIYQY
ncbi:MAG: type II toxin-antitoxin system VapC family toxin [Proteobacteria bacterium]|nr:type II toxin-antitoxin system VapC family toxin [Pseudomonadota bacterium]